MKISQICLIIVLLYIIIIYNPQYFNMVKKWFDFKQIFSKNKTEQFFNDNNVNSCNHMNNNANMDDIFNTEGALTEDADVAISDALKSVINGHD